MIQSRTQRVVTSILITAITASGPLGCAYDRSYGSHRSVPYADPQAESNRLKSMLADRRNRLSDKERYDLRVRIAELNATVARFGQPSLAEYKVIVDSLPKEPGARISFAKATVAMADRDGSLLIAPDAAQAVTWMSEVIDQRPNDGECLLLHARCLQLLPMLSRKGRLMLIRDVQQAASRLPNDARIQIEQAKLDIFERRYDDATRQLHAALLSSHIRSTQSSTAHFLLGAIAETQKQPQAAIVEYARALEDNPKNVDALYVVAMNDWISNRNQEFQEKANRVRAIFYIHALMRFQNALANLRSNNRAAAFEELRFAAAADPSNPVFPAMMKRINEQQEAINEKEKAWLKGAAGVIALGVIIAASGDHNPHDPGGSGMGSGDDADVARRNRSDNTARMDEEDRRDAAREAAQERSREQQRADWAAEEQRNRDAAESSKRANGF